MGSESASASACAAGRSARPARRSRPGLVRRQMIEPRVQDQVLHDRQLAVERERLGHVARFRRTSMLPASTELPNSVAVPRRRQQGRSASSWSSTCRSRSTEEAEDLAALDRQRHVVDGGEGPEALGEPLRLDGPRRSCPRAAGW
jgi:hypothetical protein